MSESSSKSCLRVKMSRFLHSWYLPLSLFAVAVLIAHLILPTNTADDAWFIKILEGDNAQFSTWWEFLVSRYYTWSSRSFIEAILVVFCRFPIFWRIFNFLLCIVTFWRVSSLYNPEKNAKKQWILLLGVLLFPIWILFEVGSIATTLNYLWPLAGALFALTPCIKRFLNREVKKWEWVFGILGLLYAGFAEVLCVILTVIFVGCIGYSVIKNKRILIYEFLCFCIGVGLLIFALNCPGNHSRVLQETQTWFPTYPELSVFNRAELGFSSMMKSLFLKPNLTVLALCLVLLAVGVKHKKWRTCVCASVPFLFALVFGAVGYLFSDAPVLRDVQGWVTNVGIGVRLDAPTTWLILLIFVGLLVCILVAIYDATVDKNLFWTFFILLGLGAASRIALGFSPTVWASGERTCCYLYAAMTTVSVYFLELLFINSVSVQRE